MVDLDKQYREFISRVHKEILKPAGFKKENANFRIIYPNGLCKIINFQRSLYNDRTECRFCINVGLYFQENPEQPKTRFMEYECQVRQRAGHLSKRYREDTWWCLFEGRDMEKLFGEIQQVLSEDVLPWLDRFESRRDVIRAGQSGTLNAIVMRNL